MSQTTTESRPDRPSAEPPVGTPPPGPRPGLPPWAAPAVVAAAAAWSYAPELRWLRDAWSNDPDYSHGYLVAPVAGFILWLRLRRSDGKVAPPWQWGWAVVVVSLAARAFFFDRGNTWAEAMTLLAAAGGLTLTLGGWRLLERVWPSIGYLVFMIPLPNRLNGLLSQPLQSLATDGSVAVLRLTGLWVISEGNVIYVGQHPVQVAEACNGLSMMMCLAATVVAAVLMVPMSAWMRALLTVSVVPIALASNIVRIVATTWCVARMGPGDGARLAHDAAGWLMMPLALLMVGLELFLMTWLVVEEEVRLQPMLLGKPIVTARDENGLPITGEGGDRPGPAALPPT